MRQTVVGIFTHRISAEVTLRRLEMRGFRAECIGAPPTAAVDEPPPDAGQPARGLDVPLRRLARMAASLSSWLLAPRPGEVLVKVHAGSVLEAQAARDILRACGARESGGLGQGWTNWNW